MHGQSSEVPPQISAAMSQAISESDVVRIMLLDWMNKNDFDHITIQMEFDINRLLDDAEFLKSFKIQPL